MANDAAVVRRAGEAEAVFAPSIAIGELFYGAQKSARVKENLARVETFATTVAVLPCDTDAARRFGEIKEQLRRKGRPIPTNDMWIAAIALQRGLTLATRDDHFANVDGLLIDRW